MTKPAKRAITAAVVCVIIVLVGIMVWPNMNEERGPATPGYAQDRDRSSNGRSVAAQLSDAFQSAANRVSPAVVPIYAEKTTSMPDEMQDLFHRFFGDRMPESGGERTLRSVGSGVVAREDGYILTNNHVVADAQRLTVILEDGKRYDAEVVGTDPPTDLAVIRIDARNLPVAEFGTSENLQVGQWVIAVGNPFQLLHSVTAGIISATGRTAIGLAAYEDFIQTDASINPGNSGGALADLDGRVIGINTAISSMTGVSAGVGFAIPIDMAKQIMTELIEEGGVTRGYLALLPQDITEELQRALDLPNREGALVGGVTPGGPADKAGIEPGDVIVEFDGKKIENSTRLRGIVAQANPKERVNVVVLRDGKRRTLKVTLAERPTETAVGQPQETPEEAPQALQETFGLSVQDLTAGAARQLGLDDAKGVLVASVRGGSPASDAGLVRGDVIVEADGEEVESARELERALSGVKANDTVALLVRRGENTFFAPLTRRATQSSAR